MDNNNNTKNSWLLDNFHGAISQQTVINKSILDIILILKMVFHQALIDYQIFLLSKEKVFFINASIVSFVLPFAIFLACDNPGTLW